MKKLITLAAMAVIAFAGVNAQPVVTPNMLAATMSRSSEAGVLGVFTMPTNAAAAR